MDYTFKNGVTMEARIHANGGGIVNLNSSVDQDCYIGKGSVVYDSEIHEGSAVSLSYIEDSHIRLSNVMDSTVKQSYIHKSNVSQSIINYCELRDIDVMSTRMWDSTLRDAHIISSNLEDSHIDNSHVTGAVVKASQLVKGHYTGVITDCKLRDVNTMSGHMTNMDTDAGDRVFNYQGVGFTVSTVKDNCRISDGKKYVVVRLDRGIDDMMENVMYCLSLNKDQMEQVRLVLVVNGVLEYGNEENPVNFCSTPKEAPVTMEPYNHGYRLKTHYVRLLERLFR